VTGQTRDGWVVAWGATLGILGVAAYRFFSPSPHGYLELFYRRVHGYRRD